MDKNKYFIAFIGLALGFIVSFFWTSSYNKNHGGPVAGTTAGAASGGPNQQAMMAQVAQVIEKAKSSPNDFQAQVDAAKLFNKIGRTAETIEYLKKAYEVNAVEFVTQTKTDLQGALPFIAMYYAEQNNYGESDKWIRRALDAAPDDSETRTEIASAYLQRQPPQPDKAIQELQMVLKSNPKDGHALGHLVEAYAVNKDVRATEETFNRLKQTDPTNDRISKLETVVADLKAGKPVIIPKE